MGRARHWAGLIGGVVGGATFAGLALAWPWLSVAAMGCLVVSFLGLWRITEHVAAAPDLPGPLSWLGWLREDAGAVRVERGGSQAFEG